MINSINSSGRRSMSTSWSEGRIQGSRHRRMPTVPQSCALLVKGVHIRGFGYRQRSGADHERMVRGMVREILLEHPPPPNCAPSKTRRMSKRPTPGSGLRGAELIKAICTLEELEKLSQEEETDEAAGEGAEASQGPAAKVVSEKIADLLATLKAKAEGPLVSTPS